MPVLRGGWIYVVLTQTLCFFFPSFLITTILDGGKSISSAPKRRHQLPNRTRAPNATTHRTGNMKEDQTPTSLAGEGELVLGNTKCISREIPHYLYLGGTPPKYRFFVIPGAPILPEYLPYRISLSSLRYTNTHAEIHYHRLLIRVLPHPSRLHPCSGELDAAESSGVLKLVQGHHGGAGRRDAGGETPRAAAGGGPGGVHGGDGN